MTSADLATSGEKTPLVTVLLLTYQQERYVAQALESLLAQDWPAMEVLVLDDASTDETLGVVERLLAHHPRRSIVRIMPAVRNQGLAANWNRGVAAAAGEVIIAAAGDDVSAPSRVRESANFLQANPSVHALYYNCRIIDEAGRIQHDPWRKFAGPVFRTLGHQELWKGFPFHGATAAYRTSTLRSFGPIDSRCGTEDVSSLMRAQIVGNAVALPLVLVDWRWHGANLSHGGVAAGVARAKRLKAKLRKARGAVYDGIQLQRDAQSAIKLGFRLENEVDGMLSSGRKMEVANRLKFHSLHPRSRWGVCLALGLAVINCRQISKAQGCATLVRALLRRAFPAGLRHWSV